MLSRSPIVAATMMVLSLSTGTAFAQPLLGREAETLALGGGARVVEDGKANRGEAVRLVGGDTLRARVNAMRPSRVVVRALGHCSARLSLSVGGKHVAASRPGHGYERRFVDISLSPGGHLLVFSVGGRRDRRCGRPVVRLDRVGLRHGKTTTTRSGFTGTPLPARPRSRIDAAPLGTAVRFDRLHADPAYRRALLRYFESVTPENELKIAAVQPERGRFEFGPADAIVNYAIRHGLAVRGHTLVWGNDLPGWLTHGNFSRDELIEIMRTHITTVMRHFRHRIREWDVVNEAIDEDGRFRDSLWLRVIGPSYITLAFRFARAADPKARLYYNDFATETPSAKNAGVHRIVDGMLQSKVPLHGLGFQVHAHVGASIDRTTVVSALRHFAAHGIDVQVTEMDVDGPSAPFELPTTPAFAAIARACHAVPECSRFTVWGVGDAVTWKGPLARPLLLDTEWRPKAAYWAVREALAGDSGAPSL